MSSQEVGRAWNKLAEELELRPEAEKAVRATIDALKAHHLPTAEHSMRVGIVAVRIGQHRGLPLKPLFYAGSGHDRGKLNVDPKRLSKTTEWTEEDVLALRDHPRDGYDAFIEDGMTLTAGLVVRHHTFQENDYPSADVLPSPPPYMAESFMDCAETIALADFYDAAHRLNADRLFTGEEIKAKLLAHYPMHEALIQELYESGVFTTDRERAQMLV